MFFLGDDELLAYGCDSLFSRAQMYMAKLGAHLASGFDLNSNNLKTSFCSLVETCDRKRILLQKLLPGPQPPARLGLLSRRALAASSPAPAEGAGRDAKAGGQQS